MQCLVCFCHSHTTCGVLCGERAAATPWLCKWGSDGKSQAPCLLAMSGGFQPFFLVVASTLQLLCSSLQSEPALALWTHFLPCGGTWTGHGGPRAWVMDWWWHLGSAVGGCHVCCFSGGGSGSCPLSDIFAMESDSVDVSNFQFMSDW